MRPVAVAAAIFTVLAIPAAAQSPQPPIAVTDAWARPTVAPDMPGAAYFVLSDHGPADRLTGVSTPVAAKADMHESLSENGVMKMRPVAGVPLAPGGTVTFAPGGYHVMLMGLKQPLRAGDSFPLTLTFEKAAPVTVQVKVEAKGPASGGMRSMQPSSGNKP